MTASEKEQLKIVRNTMDLILDALANGYSHDQAQRLREAYCLKISEAIGRAENPTSAVHNQPDDSGAAG